MGCNENCFSCVLHLHNDYLLELVGIMELKISHWELEFYQFFKPTDIDSPIWSSDPQNQTALQSIISVGPDLDLNPNNSWRSRFVQILTFIA